MRRTTKPGHDNLISLQWIRWSPVWLILEISHHQAQTSAQKTLKMKKYLSRQQRIKTLNKFRHKKETWIFCYWRWGWSLTKRFRHIRDSERKVKDDCRTQEGPAYMRLSRFRPSVRPSVRPYLRTYVSTLDFSFIPHAQFTSDPQYFYRFRTSYVLTIRGADP